MLALNESGNPCTISAVVLMGVYLSLQLLVHNAIINP